VFVNDAYAQMMGYESAAQFLERNREQVLPHTRPERREAVLRDLREIEAGTIDRQQREGQALRLDGTPIDAQLNWRRIQWEGRPAVLGTHMDLTGLKRAEATLRASEERYRALVESAQIGITVHVDGRGVFINLYLTKLLGYERPEDYLAAAEKREPLAHIDAAERARSLENLIRLQAGEQDTFEEQGTLRRNDGTPMYIHSSSRRVLWEGRPAVLTAILDVTKRVQLEEGLRRSEERYRTLVDGSLQGIAVFSGEDYRARFVNEALLRLAGVDTVQAYIGKARLFDNIDDPYVKPLREGVEQLLAGEREALRDELPARRRDGTAYWAEFQARRVDWDGQPAVQLTVLDITDRKRAEEALKDREAVLAKQNEFFRQDISRRRERSDKGVVTESQAMRRVLREAEMVARSRVPVLIEGETGSGKEVVAEFLHRHSDRADQMLSVVNCGALSDNLMDAELFGHEKGAFTGATDARAGMIEIADRGTLFLDEIGDLPPNGQVRLLRFLEKGVIRRVGSTRERKVDVRILAATHKTLKTQVQAGTFREDLYHRLLVIRLEVPPLRERIEDILPLARHFVEQYCAEAHVSPRTFSDDTRLALTSYSWPGNVRELSHTIQRAVLAAQLDGAEVIIPEHLDLPVRDAAESVLLPIKEVTRRAEHRHVMAALRYFNGNRKRAAESLGISERHLYRLLD
jgi:PAS domain S-box-containing protein